MAFPAISGGSGGISASSSASGDSAFGDFNTGNKVLNFGGGGANWGPLWGQPAGISGINPMVMGGIALAAVVAGVVLYKAGGK